MKKNSCNNIYLFKIFKLLTVSCKAHLDSCLKFRLLTLEHRGWHVDTIVGIRNALFKVMSCLWKSRRHVPVVTGIYTGKHHMDSNQLLFIIIVIQLLFTTLCRIGVGDIAYLLNLVFFQNELLFICLYFFFLSVCLLISVLISLSLCSLNSGKDFTTRDTNLTVGISVGIFLFSYYTRKKHILKHYI